MFGYVKIDKPELKIGDYEIYKGIYCSLCKEMGRHFGVFSRFALSYDLTFLALFKMALSNSCPKFKKSRCTFNPFKRCNCCEKDQESLLPAAYIAVILLYFKIKDNIADSGFFKKFLMYLIYPYVALAHRKAKKRYPDLDFKIGSLIEKQSELEKSGCSQIDLAAEPTALILAEIIRAVSDSEKDINTLVKFGYCLGRYIYISDAVDDMEDDLKSGSYNPFLVGASGASDAEEIKKGAKETLFRTIAELINTYEMLEFKRFKAILDNVIYDGLYKETERITDRVR